MLLNIKDSNHRSRAFIRLFPKVKNQESDIVTEKYGVI